MADRTWLRGCGWVACLAGVLIPPMALAAAIRGATDPALGTVVNGFWIFKGSLVATGAALLVLAHGSGDRHRGPTSPPLTRGEGWLLLAILAGALALRLVDLGAGLWYDEIQTLVHYVRLPAGHLLTTFDSTNQHVLYSALARIAVGVAGESNVALRLPAVLFGVGSLWALVWFGRRLDLTREALLTAGLLAVSYHHVWFSQNARGYTGLLFWGLLSSALLLDLLRGDGTPGRILGYALCAALGVYTHLTALFTIAAHGLVWLAAWRTTAPDARRQVLFAFVLAGCVSLLLYAPVLPQVAATLTAPSTEPVTPDWQTPLWMLTEAVRGLTQGVPGGLAGLILGGGVVLAGVLSIARRDPAAGGIMVLPGLVTLGVLLASHHNLWPRFFFFAAGFAGLFAVRGAMALGTVMGARGRQAASVVLVLVMAGSLTTVPRAWKPKQDFGGAADSLATLLTAEGTRAALTDMTILPFREWLGKSWPVVDAPSDLERMERQGGVTYVVVTFTTRLAAVQPALFARLETAYDTAAVFPGTVGGGNVVLFARRTAPPSAPAGGPP